MKITNLKIKILLAFSLSFICIFLISFIYAQGNDAQSVPDTRASAEIRDVPDVVYPGARVEITVDFQNTGTTAIDNATASLSLPSGASLYSGYSWNNTS